MLNNLDSNERKKTIKNFLEKLDNKEKYFHERHINITI